MSKYRAYKRITIIRPTAEEGEAFFLVASVDCPKFDKRIAATTCFPLFCPSCVARGNRQVFCNYAVEGYSYEKTRTA